MALGTNHIITTEVPNFIPELWSDEVIAAYKANLVMANLVRKLNHRGKKGDTIKIPTPTRGDASDKTAETQVTLIQHGTDVGLTISIDKHKEYSRLIEDIVDIQALESLRRFYTDDGGYAIARQVDTDLLVESFNTGSASLTYTAATNTLTTASTFDVIYEGDGTVWDETATTDISDAGIRTFVKLMDDQDAPMAGRAMVVPTIVKFDLLGLARFTEQAFVGEVAGGNSIRNGLVGDVYGVEVFVTTRTPLVEDSTATADNVSGVVLQRDSMVLVEQAGVRSQSQYKLEYLGDLFVTDMIYGVKVLRDNGGSVFPFVVPTT
jgi:N4-gp56 family major capsid protein